MKYICAKNNMSGKVSFLPKGKQEQAKQEKY